MMNVTVVTKQDRWNLQLRHTNPLTGAVVTKSAGTDNRRKAERAAAVWEAELRDNLGASGSMSWDAFLTRYEDEHLIFKARSTWKNYQSTFRKFESVIGKVRDVSAIDAAVCSRFSSTMLRDGVPATTVAKHLRQLGCALNWAESIGIINRAPKIRKPATPKRTTKGRALTLFEVCRFLIAARDTLDDDVATDWIDSLKAIWLTGLRISEAVQLHHERGPVRLDMASKYPRMIFDAEQKNAKEQQVPLTADAVKFFRRLDRTTGFALRFPGERKRRLGIQAVGRTIADIGKASGIKTGEKTHASAHDFRRSFGTRHALRVHPVILKILMRHDDLGTTLKYYVDLDCEAVAAEMFRTTPASHRYLGGRLKPQ
jgi:integrase